MGLATYRCSHNEQASDFSKQTGPTGLLSPLTLGCFETLNNTTAKLIFYMIVLRTNKACRSNKFLKIEERHCRKI